MSSRVTALGALSSASADSLGYGAGQRIVIDDTFTHHRSLTSENYHQVRGSQRIQATGDNLVGSGGFRSRTSHGE